MAKTIDVYEIKVKGEYYGTIHVENKASFSQVQERINKMFPLLRNQVRGVDYVVKFIMTTINDNY